jgi:hypothetical protein
MKGGVMKTKLRIVLAIVAVLVFSPTIVNASSEVGPEQPDQTILTPLDCGVDAQNPYRGSDGRIYTYGEVSCATKHSALKVVVGLNDGAISLASNPVYCYNTDICRVYFSRSYIANRTWYSEVSGYVGDWQAYYYSDSVYIP